MCSNDCCLHARIFLTNFFWVAGTILEGKTASSGMFANAQLKSLNARIL
jgi:hypothetical protein